MKPKSTHSERPRSKDYIYLNTEFAVELFKLLKNEPFQTLVHKLVSDAVELERQFTLDALKSYVLGPGLKGSVAVKVTGAAGSAGAAYRLEAADVDVRVARASAAARSLGAASGASVRACTAAAL